MNTGCDIVRDILPLYADDVCSAASRELVDAHLRECPACSAYLKEIRTSEVEGDLKDEKAMVIKNQARRFKRRSAAVGSVISGLFMIPILVCLIVNLTTGHALDWFFVVVAGLMVAASLIVVPLMMPDSKLFWTFCAFTVSLVILLAVCALYTGGSWFFVAASASLFGLSVVFLPFAIRAKPIKPWVEGHNKALLVLAVDFILFGNMMNMISLHSKGITFTAIIAALVVAALALLVGEVVWKEKEKQ